MNSREILVTIRNLATVDALYKQIYTALKRLKATKTKEFELTMEKLENQHFNDATDLVLFFEC